MAAAGAQAPANAVELKRRALEVREQLGLGRTVEQRAAAANVRKRPELVAGGGWDESWRCAWCAGFVLAEYARCDRCGHEPTGPHDCHSKGNARGAVSPAKRARAQARKRKNRLRL